MIYVLAYPAFEPGTCECVSRFRSAHEPHRARLVRPHVTLVFGLDRVHLQQLETACERVAAEASAIPVDFAATEVIHDPFEGRWKLCLLASAGRESLSAMHEGLYDGPHRSGLDPRIPYRPHMTVATQPDRAQIARIDISALGPLPIRGRIDALDLVELVGDRLHAHRTFRLAG